MLTPDIQWREQYTSAALNRKFSGVTPPGVYAGFTITPVAGQNLKFKVNVNGGVAVVERDGYSITVHGSGIDEEVTAAATGTSYAVIEVFYGVSQTTTATLKVVTTKSAHHCVLGKFIVTNGVAKLVANSADNATIDCGEIQ